MDVEFARCPLNRQLYTKRDAKVKILNKSRFSNGRIFAPFLRIWTVHRLSEKTMTELPTSKSMNECRTLRIP